jgi:hypothetical protein
MYVDYGSLANLDVGRFVTARARWGELARHFDLDRTAYDKSVCGPVNDGTWAGQAALAAQGGVRKTRARLTATRTYLETVLDALDITDAGFTAAQSRLKDAVAVADANGLGVDENGNVGLGELGPVNWYQPPGPRWGGLHGDRPAGRDRTPLRAPVRVLPLP